MKKLLILYTIALVVLISSRALAETFCFVDSGQEDYFWPGWSNGTSDDGKDVVGAPEITGGTVSIAPSGYLEQITFNYIGKASSSWPYFRAGDLFINIATDDTDVTWDYVVKTLGAADTPGNYNLQSVGLSAAKGFNDDAYVIWPIGYTSPRELHPTGVDLSHITSNTVGQVYFSGWLTKVDDGREYSSTYTLNTISGGVFLGSKDFIIGWTVNCANDTIYERIDNQAVPEPATLLLLASGIVELWVSKKPFVKSPRKNPELLQ